MDCLPIVKGGILITYPRKRRHPGHHLHEDAAHAPHVQRGRVLGAAQQDIWNGHELSGK